MYIKATTSDITVNFTPDEWKKVKRLLKFTVANVEEMNAADLQAMIENPTLSLEQIRRNQDNNLLR
jgi:hypothetical protein